MSEQSSFTILHLCPTTELTHCNLASSNKGCATFTSSMEFATYPRMPTNTMRTAAFAVDFDEKWFWMLTSVLCNAYMSHVRTTHTHIHTYHNTNRTVWYDIVLLISNNINNGCDMITSQLVQFVYVILHIERYACPRSWLQWQNYNMLRLLSFVLSLGGPYMTSILGSRAAWQILLSYCDVLVDVLLNCVHSQACVCIGLLARWSYLHFLCF